MTRLTFIPPQAIKVATASRVDLSQFLVAAVWIAPGTSEGRVRLWKVNLADFSNAGEIPFPNAAGKDDSVALEILADGSVLVTISEAVPGGGGATAQPDTQRILGVFPPFAGGGAVDAWARQQIAAHEIRLDRIAAGAAG